MQIYFHYSRFYITPLEQKRIRYYMTHQLKEMHKEGNNYIIKTDHSAEEGLIN